MTIPKLIRQGGLILLLIVWLSSLVSAAIPKTFKVDGQLSTSASGLLVGKHDVVFSIYQGEDSEAIWTQTIEEVTFLNGRFSASIGGDENNPIDYDVLNDETLTLGISVDGEEAQASILTSPIALVSQVAETALSVEWEHILNVPSSVTSPDIVIEDGSITAVKLADDAVTFDKISQNSASEGQVIKWNGSAWVPSSDVRANVEDLNLVEDSVTTDTIADNAVTGAKILSGTLSNAHLATGSYTAITGVGVLTDTLYGTSAEFEGTVTASRFSGDGSGLTGLSADTIADDAVTTAKIEDKAVSTAKLADDSVNSTKIRDGAIVNEDLSSGSFTNITGVGTLTTQLKGNTASFTGTVTANAFVGDGSGLTNIAADTIADEAVSTAKLADEAVTSAKIEDSTIVNDDLASGSFTNITGVGTLTTQLVGDTASFDGTVTANAFVGDGSGLTNISADTIADNSVTSAKISNGSIVNEDLASGSFTNITGVGTLTTQLVGDTASFDGTVTANAFVGDGAGLTNIAADTIADNSVTSAKISNGSIVNADLASGSFTNITGLGTLTTQLVGDTASFDGTVTANAFAGNGAGLTGLVIQDADADTQIQVEESEDEDIIRFDLGGTEYFTMAGGRLNVTNTGGSVLIGSGAGSNDDFTDNYNVFMGTESGYYSNNVRNTAIGHQALKNVLGHSNTVVGYRAGLGESEGNAYGNSFFGLDAGNTLKDGQYNIAIGHSSGAGLADGISNVAIGRYSLSSEEGLPGVYSYNVAIGESAGYRINTGDDSNILMGHNAGYNLGVDYAQDSDYNVMIGDNAGYQNDGYGNVFLGRNAGYYELGDNKLYISNSNTTSPLIYGDFSAQGVTINGILSVTGSITADSFSGDGSGLTNISADTIADDAVTTAKIEDGAVTSDKLDDGSVTNSKYADDSITTDKILNSTIYNADINDSAAIAFSKLEISKSDITGLGIPDTVYSGGRYITLLEDTFDISSEVVTQNWNGTITANAFVGSGSGLTGIVVDAVSDADSDTKIQVEESEDDDKIRFDIAGTEVFVMEGKRLEVLNTGESVFIGNDAGANDDLSTNRNTFIGEEAGYSNQSGANNVYIGRQTGYLGTAGAFNVLVGNQTGHNLAGNYNTLLGMQSGFSTTSASKNTFIGYQSGYGNGEDDITGDQNTFLGSDSGKNISTGSYNTYLGTFAGYNNTATNGGVYIGFKAGYNETAANKLYISNSDTTSPLIYGDFSAQGVTINGTLSVTGSVTADSFSGDGSGLTNISADTVADDSISAAKIEDGAVTSAKLANSSVSSSKLADASVTSAKIADDAVTSSKLADDSVTSSKINDGTITNSDISNTASIAFGKLDIGKSDITGLGIPDTVYSGGTYITLSDDTFDISSDVVTRNWSGTITANRLVSTVTTGTAPFKVSSTTKVSNLNADTLDGVDSTAFLQVSNNLSDISSASTARTNLGLAIGTNVQAYDSDLTAIAGLSPSEGEFLGYVEGSWDTYSSSTAKTFLGLGSSDSVSFSAINVLGTVTANLFVGSGAGLTNITADTVADASISSDKLLDGSVTSAKLAVASVTSSKIADESITTSKLADDSVTNSKLADDSVTSSKIEDGTITNSDISASAAIAFSKLAIDVEDILGLGSIDTVTTNATKLQQRSISVTAPSVGEVLKWDGESWSPASDEDSDTTYTAGAHMILDGSAFRIDGDVVTRNYHGSITANYFVGDGSRLSNIDGSNIVDGSISGDKLQSGSIGTSKLEAAIVTSNYTGALVLQSQLSVSSLISVSSSSSSGSVGYFSNNNTDSEAGVLQLSLGAPVPGADNNYISFMSDSTGLPVEVGAISGSGFGSVDYALLESASDEAVAFMNKKGVVLNSSGADYAEYILKEDTSKEYEAGELVGIKAGKIVDSTADVDRVMSISARPIVIGNTPSENSEDYELVAFVGQVFVKVKGAVESGQYIVASDEAGVGVAKNSRDLTSKDMVRIVGQVWETSTVQDLRLVKVGITPMDLTMIQADRLNALEAKLEKLLEKIDF